MMFPKPQRAERKPRKRIRTYRPAGTKRREAKAAGGVDPDTWKAICDWYTVDGVVMCAYGCDRPATEQDHVIAISKGGKHEPGNVVPSDTGCNQVKGQQTWEVDSPHPWMKGHRA